MHVQRPISELLRLNPNWYERWGEPQAGFITCWERGRELATQNPALAVAARAGVLVPLSWKGGSSKQTKPNRRYGCFYYLATWQGLRGEDLNIDTEAPFQLRCTKYDTLVTFTEDLSLLERNKSP